MCVANDLAACRLFLLTRDVCFAQYVVPEIMNGKNIADFIDKDVMAKLQVRHEMENARKTAIHNSFPLPSHSVICTNV